VGVVWGRVPCKIYFSAFRHRILLVKKLKHVVGSSSRDHHKEHSITAQVYFEFKTTEDRSKQRALRVVICIPHKEHFQRACARGVTPISHALMAIEHLIDMATLIAYRQVPRPCLLSRSFWLVRLSVVLPLGLFNLSDQELASQLRTLVLGNAVIEAPKKWRDALKKFLRCQFCEIDVRQFSELSAATSDTKHPRKQLAS
jgi:hypothetical protein